MLKDAITIACARAAHEANRAYCLALGDETQAPWHDAPDWQKESAIEGVAARWRAIHRNELTKLGARKNGRPAGNTAQ
jgi:hypothetical protein